MVRRTFITQTANLLIPLLPLGITDAVFRFAIDEAEGAAGIFTTGFFVLLAGNVLAGLLALCGSAELDSAWLIAAFLIASNFHTLPAQFVRAKGEMTCFAVQGLLNTALVIGLNILFLAVFRLGVTGYVLSTVAADVLTTAYLVLRARLWRWLKRPAKGTLGRMLRYCVPLIPTATFWWITSVSDRYMITAWLGSAANGVYAAAAKLPTILTVRSSVFMEAWRFSAVTEQQEGTEAHLQFYASVWRTFVAGMVLSASGVITFSQLAVRLLAEEEEFFAAWQFVPVLCLAMVFAAFSAFFSSVYVISKKSTLSFWTALLGANTAGVAIRFAGAPVWMLGYIFLSGAVAITAMVLPGISGSTILLIAGVYLPAIQAVKTFLSLDFSVFPGLCVLGLGVLAGIGLSIHAIRAALRKYRSPMVWFILGLMAGSLYAIVMGSAGLDAPQAPVGPQTFDVLGFALGIAILLGLEALHRWTAQHPAPEAPRGKRATT